MWYDGPSGKHFLINSNRSLFVFVFFNLLNLSFFVFENEHFFCRTCEFILSDQILYCFPLCCKGSCDFENHTCGWVDTSDSSYRWIRQMANVTTVPGLDHTTGSPSGESAMFHLCSYFVVNNFALTITLIKI